MRLNYFIVCHDQNIINKQIKNNQFIKLNNYKYLFVGNKNIDKLNNQVVCRDLEHNIENYNSLCSFTAWYAVSKNNISDSKKICFIEYDTNIISEPVLNDLEENEINCYSITLFDHYVFYKSTPWLEIALKKIYNINLHDFVKHYSDRYKFWPTTTNIALTKDILDKFVDWFLPMTEIFKHDSLGAYVHERAFFIFCILHNIKMRYSANTFDHQQASSHKINDFYGSFLSNKNSTELTELMIPEYDELYDRLLKNCLAKL